MLLSELLENDSVDIEELLILKSISTMFSEKRNISKPMKDPIKKPKGHLKGMPSTIVKKRR